jgi:lipopolysaccharide transport system ATP-binding protein
MSSSVIRVENLSKQYQIGARENGYTTFREALTGLVANPLRRFRNLSGQAGADESFWALKDVSFEVQPGEVVGIIGHNGAGKSTLLKILSQITEPTEGRVEINGRVASLLEVGTGFHPELTGRENIYLNGSILGMSRAEVRRKFDEIVAFAEVEKFLDMPVKKYSSGMGVRLAFSVAAHLEPEILVIDEVLAVGDQAFQQKCVTKMSGVAQAGRTILCVSHNMAAVENLCHRAIVLERGALVIDCEPRRAIARYGELISHDRDQPVSERIDRKGSGQLRLSSLRLRNSLSDNANVVAMGEDWVIELEFTGAGRVPRPVVGLVVTSVHGQRIARIMSTETYGDLPAFERGCRLSIQIKNLNLLAGFYQLIVDLSDEAVTTIDRVERAATIEVIPKDVFGQGKVSDGRQSRSLCFFRCEWDCSAAQSSVLV